MQLRVDLRERFGDRLDQFARWLVLPLYRDRPWPTPETSPSGFSHSSRNEVELLFNASEAMFRRRRPIGVRHHRAGRLLAKLLLLLGNGPTQIGRFCALAWSLDSETRLAWLLSVSRFCSSSIVSSRASNRSPRVAVSVVASCHRAHPKPLRFSPAIRATSSPPPAQGRPTA